MASTAGRITRWATLSISMLSLLPLWNMAPVVGSPMDARYSSSRLASLVNCESCVGIGWDESSRCSCIMPDRRLVNYDGHTHPSRYRFFPDGDRGRSGGNSDRQLVCRRLPVRPGPENAPALQTATWWSATWKTIQNRGWRRSGGSGIQQYHNFPKYSKSRPCWCGSHIDSLHFR